MVGKLAKAQAFPMRERRPPLGTATAPLTINAEAMIARDCASMGSM
jgi:hypothetical protein